MASPGPLLRLALILLAAAAFAAPADADPTLVFGFSDDAAKWDGNRVTGPARDVGARAIRLNLGWAPGQVDLDPAAAGSLGAGIAAASGMRVVLAVTGPPSGTPQTDAARTEFCTYAKNALVQFPSIKDLVVWNEPNLAFFWKPQFNADATSAAPAAYEALLARCWDILHAYRSDVNVVAPATSPRGNDNPNAVSNIGHSPVNFVRKMAAAYRTSARQQRILDTIDQHVYGLSNGERPWRMHPGGTGFTQGDWNRLVQTYQDAFAGTAQPVPGSCSVGPCVSIWYLESGFQTTVDPTKAAFYTGFENVITLPDDAGNSTLPWSPSVGAESPDSQARDQSTQFRSAVRLAYCQPYVTGLFNFLIRDEQRLAGWQSGVLWADFTQKRSYGPLKTVVSEARGGNVSCSPPSTPTGLTARLLVAPTRVSLTWNGSTSVLGVSGYKIFRNGVEVGQTYSSSGYIDSAVTAGASYSYAVRGFDAAGGVGLASSPASIKLP